jgi:acyl-coenzyme A thioesterase PaaI-like protein
MTNDIDVRLRKAVGSPDNHCFGCGPSNPVGLRLQVERENGVARAQFVPGEWHEGWEGYVHGGVLAAALDEVMAYALYYEGIMGVTARMELRYRAPVRQDDRLLIEARMVRDTSRITDIEGAILRDGETVVQASGRFMKLGTLNL